MTIKILEARARTDTRSGMEMTEKGGEVTEPGSSLTNVGHAASTSAARKRNSQSRMIRRAWQGAQTDVNTSLLVAVIVAVGVGLGVVVSVAVGVAFGVADIVAVGVGGDGEELVAKYGNLAESSESDPRNFGELRMCKVFAICNELTNCGEPVKGPEPENGVLAANTADIVAAACLNVGDDVNSPLPANVGDFVTTRETISGRDPNDFEPANVGDFGKLREDENQAVVANFFVAAIGAELEKSGDLNVNGHPAGNDGPVTKSTAYGIMNPCPVHFQKLLPCQIGMGDMSKIVLTKWKKDSYSPPCNSTRKVMVLPEYTQYLTAYDAKSPT